MRGDERLELRWSPHVLQQGDRGLWPSVLAIPSHQSSDELRGGVRVPMRQTARPLADDRPHSLVPVEESTGAGPVLETDVSGCPQPVDGMQRTWQDLLKRVEIGRGRRDQPGHDPQERTLALRRAQQLKEPHRRIPHHADSRDKLSSTHLGGAHLAKMCPGLWRGRLQVHG